MTPTNPPTAAEPLTGDSTGFVERRKNRDAEAPEGERRQFANSHSELTPAARELALAIDEYKLRHRRRFITYEEMYDVICQLGYRREG